jgi:hypothetical protein
VIEGSKPKQKMFVYLSMCVGGVIIKTLKWGCVKNVQELLFEEKNKLGSMPPSCHSKCNECHPCMAVQVPSLPTHDSIPSKVSAMKKWLNPSLQGNMYSNYKPLGWKCHCGDHFFNP